MAYPLAVSPHRPVTGVFFVQYISMILIILTVIAGVLTRRTSGGPTIQGAVSQSAASQRAFSTESVPIVSSSRPISEWTAFRPHPDAVPQSLRESEWNTFREILSQHDVTLSIELVVPSAVQGFAAAANIRSQLLSPGMSADAVQVSFRVERFGETAPMMRLRWQKAAISREASYE